MRNTYQVVERKHCSPGPSHLYRLFNKFLSRKRAGLCWTEIKTNCLCESKFFPRSCYASRSPEQVCHAFCWRANQQKLLQSVRKSCQFVKLTTWRKPGVLLLFDEKAQSIEHNTRGWNTALFQNVRVHLVLDWFGVLTGAKLDHRPGLSNILSF